MEKIQKLNVSSLGRDNNTRFTDLQRLTLNALPRDDNPCFAAMAVDQDKVRIEDLRSISLEDLLADVKRCLEQAPQARKLYFLKLNASRFNAIPWAPHDLNALAEANLLNHFPQIDSLLVKHPLAPYEAFRYQRD